MTGPTFEAAVLPCVPELRRLALRATRGRADDADDLVQETVEAALEAWPTFRLEAATPIAWLARILMNRFINAYRKRRRHARIAEAHQLELEDLLGSMGPGPGGDVGLSAVVREALEALDDDQRDVVERACVLGEKYHEIAAARAIPVGTVMSRLHRARRLLEARLADYASANYGIGRAR